MTIDFQITREQPVSFDIRWYKTTNWRRPNEEPADEYVNVITWADGTVEELHTLPREWRNLAAEMHLAKVDASLAALAAEHAEGRTGLLPITPDQEAKLAKGVALLRDVREEHA